MSLKRTPQGRGGGPDRGLKLYPDRCFIKNTVSEERGPREFTTRNSRIAVERAAGNKIRGTTCGWATGREGIGCCFFYKRVSRGLPRQAGLRAMKGKEEEGKLKCQRIRGTKPTEPTLSDTSDGGGRGRRGNTKEPFLVTNFVAGGELKNRENCWRPEGWW